MTRQAGFTLLEVLVGLVVLGFILAGIGGGVQFGQRAAEMQARSVAAHTDMASADRVLRQLVAQVDPGSQTEAPDFTGGAATLGFTADLGRAAAGLASGDAAIGLGVDSGHRLVMRWITALHAIRLQPAAAPTVTVLMDGVERVEFAYWGRGGQWISAWNEKELPRLVRIRLRFMPDTHRSWPDIIAATDRRRPSG